VFVLIVNLSGESAVASDLYYVAKSVVPASGTALSRIAEARRVFPPYLPPIP